jgi:UDP-N-acetylglucosamine:LPS N-acetylglucosamine transferase
LAEVGSASAFALPERLFAKRVDNHSLAGEVRPIDGPRSFDGAAPAPLRILLIASAGGHWIELHRLRDAFIGADCQFVSTSKGMTPPLGHREVLEVGDTARDTAWGMLPTIISLFRIMRAFDPDLVVSTGAAPGALGLLVAKLFGARTIWIDSIANSEVISLSARLVKPVADLRVTQWPQIAERDRSLQYIGQIL